MPFFEPLENLRRVGEHEPVGFEHRHPSLSTDRLDVRAVVRVNVDPFDLDALVARGERDPLDVRREGDPVDADQIQFFRLKNQICAIVVTTIRPHEYAYPKCHFSSGMRTKFWP